MKARQWLTGIALLVGVVAMWGLDRQAWAQSGAPPTAGAPSDEPAHDESRWLRNVRQLTSTEMGLARSGEAYFSPDMQRISFQAYPLGKDSYQIYVMNLDGSNLKMVSTGIGATTCSFFHPSGQKMIFAANHDDLRPATEVEAYRPRGRETRGRESRGRESRDRSERWAASDEPADQLAKLKDSVRFVCVETGEIFTIKRSDIPSVLPAKNPKTGKASLLPVIERDGKYVVNPRYGHGLLDSPKVAEINRYVDPETLAVLNAPRPLDDARQHPGGHPGGQPGGHPGGQPGGHPGEDSGPKHGGGAGHAWQYYPGMEIYEYTFATGELKALTHSDGYDAECVYSPDGKQIVFASFRDGDQEIYICDADGKNPRRITYAKGGDGGPFFSPDGRRITYRSDRHDTGMLQIFVNNTTGTDEKAVTGCDVFHWCPYWHPSGKWLVFTRVDFRKPGRPNFDLYLVRDDGSEMHRMSSDKAFDGLPVFSPDGRRLMWTSTRNGIDAPQIFIADFIGLTPDGKLISGTVRD